MPPAGFVKKKTPKAVVSPSSRDLEWAAGFLEGEGSFVGHGGTQAVVCPQVNLEPIERLKRLFGGSISLKKTPPQHSDQWYWQVSGSRARGVMLTLYPLLTGKRQGQVRRAFDASRKPMEGNVQGAA